MNARTRRMTAIVMLVATATMGSPPVSAGLITSEAYGARDRVAAVLAREDLRARLQTYGVQPGEIQARIDALNEDELAQLADRLDSLPAGGDGIVGAILLVFLVLLLTDIAGLTKVFPFTRSIK